MQVELSNDTMELLEKLVGEFNRFNGNLEDIKEMIAPLLGFIIKKEVK